MPDKVIIIPILALGGISALQRVQNYCFSLSNLQIGDVLVAVVVLVA